MLLQEVGHAAPDAGWIANVKPKAVVLPQLLQFVQMFGAASPITSILAQNSSASPSAARHNLQCQPARGVNTRAACYWSHACKSCKRSKGVKRNDILERKFPSKTRTVP
jgi:hypothetical protein